MARLPKQWAHWCQRAGLRPETRRRARGLRAWRNLRGHGRAWRVTDGGQLQCDVYVHFKHWTAHRTVEAPLPTSLLEFLRTTGRLLDRGERLARVARNKPHLLVVPPEQIVEALMGQIGEALEAEKAAGAKLFRFNPATSESVALNPAQAA